MPDRNGYALAVSTDHLTSLLPSPITLGGHPEDVISTTRGEDVPENVDESSLLPCC
jgi:hypothetical protein